METAGEIIGGIIGQISTPYPRIEKAGEIIGMIIGIIVMVLLIAGVIFIFWVLPIKLGIKQARKKNYSPAWMWFGVHPLTGWIMYTVLACLRPRIQCGSCGGFVKDNFVRCPICHEAVVPARGQESTTTPTAPAQNKSKQPQSLVCEEYNLGTAVVLGALRDKDNQELPDVSEAVEKSDIEWYTMESSTKKCKQIILEEKTVALCKPPIGGPFLYGPLQRVRAWGMGTVYSGNVPYLCIKCVGVEEAIKTIPCRLAFSFYRYSEAGLFQPLLEIPHNTNKPFIVENPWNLGGTDILRIAKDLLSRPYLILQFFDSYMLGIHARVIKPPEDCMNTIRALFDEACKYNASISGADFRAAENRYYDMNPADESPILKK